MDEPTLDLQAGIAAYIAAFRDLARQALSDAGTLTATCPRPLGPTDRRP